MLAKPVYMDNQATTRVDPRVVEALLPYFTERYGNAGSISHSWGWEAKDAVDQARETIASAVGAQPREIVFTSGATESNNLAVRGVAERGKRKGNHLISVTTEHKAVLDPLDRLGRRGYEITLLEVAPAGSDQSGLLDPQQVADALRSDTALVSVMLANNEMGVIQPLAEIGELCRARRAAALRRDASGRQDPGRRHGVARRPDEFLGAARFTVPRALARFTCRGAARRCGCKRRLTAEGRKPACGAER